MKYTFSLLLLVLLLFACQPPPSPLGPAAAYFPATDLLRRGVVNKYYFHYTSADGYEKSTDILYYCYRLLPDDRLEITTYDAGYQPILRNITSFDSTQQIVDFQEKYYRGDTLSSDITANIVYTWAGDADTTRLETLTGYGDGIQERFSFRQNVRATNAPKQPKAVTFFIRRTLEYTFPDRATRRDTALLEDLYRSGFGLFERQVDFPDGQGVLELVAQMPRKQFQKLRAAAPKRVAYIDPSATLDAGQDFRICNPKAFIYDYYNGSPDGGYIGGKRALQKIFSERLDPTLTRDVSGYLTFRFVINCSGQAGRFVTEEAALDYKRTEFPQPLVQHVYGILHSLTEWRATVVRDEAVDAYAYLTLKFRAGELLEILP